MAGKMRVNSKDKLLKPKVRDRRQAPKMGKKGKQTVILCPFCKDPHPISTLQPSLCGTILEVTARQLIYKNTECALCHGKDGEMVQVGPELFRHIRNCSPGKELYTTPPKPSYLAKLLFPLPESTHLLVARLFGKVSVELQDAHGKPTGQYTWKKIR